MTIQSPGESSGWLLRLRRHPVAHATISVAILASFGFGLTALWFWNHGEDHLSPTDPGVVLLAAVFKYWLLAWVAALLAALVSLSSGKNLIGLARWCGWMPLAVMVLDVLAGRAIGYR
ncbi:MAG: hypothetical protein ACHRHE_14410 [Tepidisphaerales bacterium]